MYEAHDVLGRLRAKFEKLRNSPYQLNKVKLKFESQIHCSCRGKL